MDTTIEQLIVGQLHTNAYLVCDRRKEAICIIDPGDDAAYITDHILASGCRPVAILLTHGHFDHCLAAFELQNTFDVPVYLDRKDEFLVDRMQSTATKYLGHSVVEPSPQIDVWIEDEIHLSVGPFEINVIACPGHTPGGVSYGFGSDVFTGDTLFAEGLIGDWRHAYSDKKAVMESVSRLLALPENTRIHPGHGNETTVGNELIFREAEKKVYS